MLALEFPPLGHMVDWKPFLLKNSELFGINKVVLIYLFAVAFTLILFTLGNKKQLVPTGAQNLSEIAIEFVEDGIVMETMGKEGLPWTPFLLSIFFFVFFTNIFEIVPVMQMPASARIALPMFLALLTWVLFIYAGLRHQGPKYFVSALFPPGVPKPLYILVTPIELISFLLRPVTLALRLFGNMLGGHVAMKVFAGFVVSLGAMAAGGGLGFLGIPGAALALSGVVALTALEFLVAFLQAFVFAVLACVYLNDVVNLGHHH